MPSTTQEPPITEQELESSLIADLGAAISESADYALSRLSLLAVEAKVAITSIVVMLVMALFVVILLCTSWGLICYLFVSWLTAAGHLTIFQAIGSVLLVNLLGLVVTAKFILSLAKSLSFDKSLRFSDASSAESSA